MLSKFVLALTTTAAAALRVPVCLPRAPNLLRSRSPVAYDGGPAPTRTNAVLDENAAEAEDGAMLLVRMQCPASVDGHYWSELLVDAGALYVTLSDGGVGTPSEQHIFHAHPPGDTSAALLARAGSEAVAGHLTPVWANSVRLFLRCVCACVFCVLCLCVLCSPAIC